MIDLNEIIRQTFFIGFVFGVFILEFILLIALSIVQAEKIKRHEKYLIETKQSQRYNEYLESQKLIKSDAYKRLFR